MSDPIPFKSTIEPLSPYFNLQTTVDVLRLDQIHPVVSGNKWFKLKKYIEDAKQGQKKLVTFGGAYSNHLVATAAAAQKEGLQSVGFVRGEVPCTLAHTLRQAQSFGMQLRFTSRDLYRKMRDPEKLRDLNLPGDCLIIPEGGYGSAGAEGAMGILSENETGAYSHLLCAVGTGTTLAGLIMAAKKGQKLIGIPVLKNAHSLRVEINALLPREKHDAFELIEEYHFGGYAKKTAALLSFQNDLYSRTGIPTDFVYTGKAFFAVLDLVRNRYFTEEDKVLLVHTGGLQGNGSLEKGTLIFD